MTPSVLAALVLGSLLAAAGQLLFKGGADKAVLLADFLNWRILAGLICYGASTLMWIWALSRAPLFAVYPFTALTFVLVYLGSIFVFAERLTLTSFAGVSLVLIGLLLIVVLPNAKSADKQTHRSTPSAELRQ